MNKITRHNYEEFFLDYLDGTLNPDQMNELEFFLIQNPDLKEELEEMECPVVAQESISIELNLLKEIPFRNSFDDFCIARLEGDLLVDDEIAFDLFLEKNETFKNESNTYQKTILIPDDKVVFENKEGLKKDERKIAFWWYFSRIGAAASVLLLFSLWSIFYQYEDVNTDIKSISQVQPEPTKVENLVVEKVTPIDAEKNSGFQTEKIKEAKSLVKELQELSGPKKVPAKDFEKIVEKVALPVLSSNVKVAALSNKANFEPKLKVIEKVSIETVDQNNGLAQLGMSWKSSAPKKKSSVLYAIAKYGVDKIGEIAGKNVKLEKTYDSVTEKTRLNFKSEGIGFSKTIK